MRRRSLGLAVASCLLVACTEGPTEPRSMLPIAAANAPNVIQVPRDYATIQDAVDNAVAGNEILVRGNYTELVTVNTAGIRVRGLPGAHLTGTFNVQASGVSIDGFLITTAFHNQGIQTNTVTGVEIKNNTIVSDGSPGDFRAIWLFNCQNCSIKNNQLFAHRFEGIAVVGNATGTEVKNNTANGNGGQGIFMWPGSTGASVVNNEAFGNGFCGIVDASGTGGHTFKNNRTNCTFGF